MFNQEVIKMTHLKFERDYSYRGKTEVYSVISTHDDSELGEIKWCGGWRQYILEPVTGFVL